MNRQPSSPEEKIDELVVGGHHCKAGIDGGAQQRLVTVIGEQRGEARDASVSIRFHWGKEGFGLLYRGWGVSYSTVTNYSPRRNKPF
jgi:hypothetical protein